MPTLTRRRRLAAWLLATCGAASVSALCWPGPAVAQEPDVASWWSAANVGDPAPAPPAPPDVKEGDLLVQGSNPAPVPGSPIGSAPGGAQAVAGLAFDLQPTDIVGALTLKMDGAAPPQVSVVACRATERFTHVENGPWPRVPGYDADACVPGALKDDKVVFADVAKLVRDAQLAVVLLPGPVDRVVFAKPGSDALDVTHAGGVGAQAPSFGSGTDNGPAPAGGGRSGGGAVGAPAGPGPSAPTELPPAAVPDNGAGVPPVVAGDAPAPAPTATPAAATPVAAHGGMSTATRRWLALAVIALEVLGFGWVIRSPDPSRLPQVAGAAAAGGRLRPPDRVAGGRIAAVGGVGRFRRERQSPAPRI
jgi:hypothetical protein